MLVQSYEAGARLNDIPAVTQQLRGLCAGGDDDAEVAELRRALITSIARWYGRGLFHDGEGTNRAHTRPAGPTDSRPNPDPRDCVVSRTALQDCFTPIRTRVTSCCQRRRPRRGGRYDIVSVVQIS
eukprot:COSAG01_NODE_463_length_16671_cov_192.938209_16_plen_126_part_00